MKYDFDRVLDRTGTRSTKWKIKHFTAPNAGREIVPFTMADMEFPLVPEIREGLKEYLDQAVLGYTGATEEYYQSVQDWMEKHHGFRPPRKWFLECSGVISALDEMLTDRLGGF